MRPSLARGTLTATWRVSDPHVKLNDALGRVDMSLITHSSLRYSIDSGQNATLIESVRVISLVDFPL